MDSYQVLPYHKSVRIIGFYISQNEIVYWDGKMLKCKHKKRKQRCLECGGGEYCKHGQYKSRCKECGGKELCKHDIRKAFCRECEGSVFCEHGTRKYICKKCKGSSICKHDVIKNTCKICKPQTYLVNIMRRRVLHALKGKKDKSTMKYVGCDYENLKSYLEKKFLPGMNWENTGDWHIDHIRPCSSFNLNDEEEKKMCFHYTNLQPLWKKDNLKKGTKFDPKTFTRKWNGEMWIE